MILNKTFRNELEKWVDFLKLNIFNNETNQQTLKSEENKVQKNDRGVNKMTDKNLKSKLCPRCGEELAYGKSSIQTSNKITVCYKCKCGYETAISPEEKEYATSIVLNQASDGIKNSIIKELEKIEYGTKTLVKFNGFEAEVGVIDDIDDFKYFFQWEPLFEHIFTLKFALYGYGGTSLFNLDLPCSIKMLSDLGIDYYQLNYESWKSKRANKAKKVESIYDNLCKKLNEDFTKFDDEHYNDDDYDEEFNKFVEASYKKLPTEVSKENVLNNLDQLFFTKEASDRINEMVSNFYTYMPNDLEGIDDFDAFGTFILSCKQRGYDEPLELRDDDGTYYCILECEKLTAYDCQRLLSHDECTRIPLFFKVKGKVYCIYSFAYC